jgi:hypothetical protein
MTQNICSLIELSKGAALIVDYGEDHAFSNSFRVSQQRSYLLGDQRPQARQGLRGHYLAGWNAGSDCLRKLLADTADCPNEQTSKSDADHASRLIPRVHGDQTATRKSTAENKCLAEQTARPKLCAALRPQGDGRNLQVSLHWPQGRRRRLSFFGRRDIEKGGTVRLIATFNLP